MANIGNDASLLLQKNLTAQLRALQTKLVGEYFSDDSMLKISQLIEQCHQVDTDNDKARRLEHFNFAIAQQNPNEILPFSPITGYYNPVAPDIDVQYDRDSKELTAYCTLDNVFEGPPNMVHGGTLAAIFDQILAMCGTCNHLAGPTATLTIDYLKPTPLHAPLVFTCKILKQEGRKIYIEGICTVNEEVTSKAQGLFIFYQAP